MAKYLLTFEVDTDLDEYGYQRGSNYDHQPTLTDEDVEQFAQTFGASPGSQWESHQLPFVKTIGVERKEEA